MKAIHNHTTHNTTHLDRKISPNTADAFSEQHGFVLEIEAGRAIANNAFLKDLFQACTMRDVRYFGVAVRNDYRGSNDFERMTGFFDALYASQRLNLPFEGMVGIGY